MCRGVVHRYQFILPGRSGPVFPSLEKSMLELYMLELFFSNIMVAPRFITAYGINHKLPIVIEIVAFRTHCKTGSNHDIAAFSRNLCLQFGKRLWPIFT